MTYSLESRSRCRRETAASYFKQAAGNEAGIGGGEINISGREFFGLAGAAQRDFMAEVFHFRFGMVPGMFGVQTGPGTTALTRMFRLPSASARDLVKV